MVPFLKQNLSFYPFSNFSAYNWPLIWYPRAVIVEYCTAVGLFIFINIFITTSALSNQSLNLQFLILGVTTRIEYKQYVLWSILFSHSWLVLFAYFKMTYSCFFFIYLDRTIWPIKQLILDFFLLSHSFQKLPQIFLIWLKAIKWFFT